MQNEMGNSFQTLFYSLNPRATFPYGNQRFTSVIYVFFYFARHQRLKYQDKDIHCLKQAKRRFNKPSGQDNEQSKTHGFLTRVSLSTCGDEI